MSLDEADLTPAAGWIAPEVSAEFPGLRLDWVTVAGARRPSPAPVVRRLRRLAGRYRGESVVAMRTQAIPHAYRTFYRQIGLDPDVERIPSEAAAVNRLLHGGFRSRDLIQDALLIAVIETGIPVWALDADGIDAAGLGIRVSTETDRLGDEGEALGAGQLVVADAAAVHAVLFGRLAPGHEVTARSRRVTLFSVGVTGVPAIHVEEALWMCMEALGES
jgi:DNA/RNA-binding domain of Phe-tRNA-synthetase-like protein